MKSLFLVLGLLMGVSAGFAQVDPGGSLGVKIGDSRPQLSFQLLSGEPLPKWDELKGKVVVIDFWATWCEPCVSAIPALNQLHQEFAKTVRFFSVTYEPDPHVKDFLRDHPIYGEVGIDNDLETFKTFKAWGIPVVFIFDGSGKFLSAVHPNKLTRSVLASAVEGKILTVEQSKPWSDPDGAEKYFRKNQRELQEKYGRVGH